MNEAGNWQWALGSLPAHSKILSGLLNKDQHKGQIL